MRNPRALKDHTGRRWGRLIALRMLERGGADNNHLWLFKCDCGNEKKSRIKVVASGNTTSCGCVFKQMMAKRNTTHGMSGSPTYRSWKDMRSRCNCSTDSDYPDYGGRGITVCTDWDDYTKFVADMGERPHGMTIDRIDVNGHYDKSNCRWATDQQQANNKRTNRLVTMEGRTQTLQQWADEKGIERGVAAYRLNVGYPPEEAFKLEDKRIG